MELLLANIASELVRKLLFSLQLIKSIVNGEELHRLFSSSVGNQFNFQSYSMSLAVKATLTITMVAGISRFSLHF